jgi:hypothetical protein
VRIKTHLNLRLAAMLLGGAAGFAMFLFLIEPWRPAIFNLLLFGVLICGGAGLSHFLFGRVPSECLECGARQSFPLKKVMVPVSHSTPERLLYSCRACGARCEADRLYLGPSDDPRSIERRIMRAFPFVFTALALGACALVLLPSIMKFFHP